MGTRPRRALLGVDHLRQLRRNPLDFYARMAAQHGDAVLVRLGPYRVWLLFHPADVHTVLVEHARELTRFEPVMRVLSQWNGRSLLIAEGEAWQAQKRAVVPAFQPARMPGYAAGIVASAVRLRDRWCEVDEIECDVDACMVELTLELAARALFDIDLRVAPDIGRAVAIFSDVAYRESTAILPVLPDWWPSRRSRDKAWAIAFMDRTVHGLIAERIRQGAQDRGDLLSTLLEQRGGADGIARVRDEAMTLLIAGHETTSAGLTWLFHLLATHPEILSWVYDELDTVLEADTVPTPSHLRRLPRLEAALRETLRLYPPAYTLFVRRARQAITLPGAIVRAGDLMQAVPFVTQRDARWFEDPKAFRPSRFLPSEPAWPRHAYLPFGLGPRACPGQAFGMMEMLLVAAVLLRSLAPESLRQPVLMDARFSLRPAGGLPMRWRRRA